MWWGSVCIDLSIFPPSFVVLRSTVVQNTTFVLLLYSRSVSGGFFLDYLSPFILTCRCPNCSVHWFFNMLLDDVFCKAWPSLQEIFFDYLEYSCYCWAEKFCMNLLCKFLSSCLGQSVICHKLWLLCLQRKFLYSSLIFLVPFIISCPSFWTDISFLSSVMVHPSSHETPNDISVAIFTFGKCEST